jgi:hypothetical protein
MLVLGGLKLIETIGCLHHAVFDPAVALLRTVIIKANPPAFVPPVSYSHALAKWELGRSICDWPCLREDLLGIGKLPSRRGDHRHILRYRPFFSESIRTRNPSNLFTLARAIQRLKWSLWNYFFFYHFEVTMSKAATRFQIISLGPLVPGLD